MKLANLLLNLVAVSAIPAEEVAQDKTRLLQLTEQGPAKWFSEAEFYQLLKEGKHFVDKTDDGPEPRSLPKIVSNFAIPTQVKYKTQTVAAQSFLDTNRAKSWLTQLSNFHTRYYSSPTGLQAAQFIRDHAKSIASKYKGTIAVEEFKHTWNQPSIIVRITGSKLPNEIVVLGAHLDSINQNNPTTGRSPGADDDGSGSALLIEVLQSLVSANFVPQRTIEFQFYAAEEVGLKGSRAIARSYRQAGKNVVAMLQQDMVGYKPANVNTISVKTDYSDPQLVNFISTLITTYTKHPVKRDSCGYACSDHASFNESGYKAAIQSETVLARGYHTERDVISDMDFEYFKEFCKVATGFAIELAEPAN
ncbi:Zn-dependent exopeptidase [Conidiobolus coronatus NRRL 28638]|uniref:Peptide hydrolase n=1 Tax=Conidiobolus coronatus (strain ATCC 28846 / CBS 209.66 / NRRL 28638) TaxID=796925 RepID=A0A137P0Q4_CONC2|nr:Zn-dependent exopeptidase [Conidiobolus coronatus NRRL 28638]|eukprot:KXN68646.1 Zn-dependent exopeptidase [Conidiobolus coronatus NRRL 28638]